MNLINLLAVILLITLCVNKGIIDQSNEVAIIHNNNAFIACEESKNVEDYLTDIISNPNKFVMGVADTCVLALMDSLCSQSIRHTDERYFIALGAICRISDGYVSEHLMTIAVKQYYYNLNRLLSYVYQDSCFRQHVVLGLSMEVSVGGNKTMDMIKNHAGETELSVEKRKLLDEILSEINPEIFD
ncbi:MAG: hypothetical protein IPH61_15090 [Bacteroidetes bacterium]|nr:hypothetical protein [Bacteroidota bacterium]